MNAQKRTIIADMNNLYEKTIKLIRDSGLPLSQISSGAGVGKRWLADLMSGRYSDPGVKKIQLLHDYLIKKLSEAVGERRQEPDRRSNRRKAK